MADEHTKGAGMVPIPIERDYQRANYAKWLAGPVTEPGCYEPGSDVGVGLREPDEDPAERRQLADAFDPAESVPGFEEAMSAAEEDYFRVDRDARAFVGGLS